MLRYEDWGKGLWAYAYSNLEFFAHYFMNGYNKEKGAQGVVRQLPMDWRRWRLSVIESSPVTLMLSFPSPPPSTDHEILGYPIDKFGQPPGTVPEMVVRYNSGEHIAHQNDADWFPDILRMEAWGKEVALKHIGEQSPSFEDAQRLMTDAYFRLFELERTLRAFVEDVLRAKHRDGWWAASVKDTYILNEATRTMADANAASITKLDLSEIHFVSLASLAKIIRANNDEFSSKLNDHRGWFQTSLASLDALRNAIGHVRKLNARDLQRFNDEADHVLAAIQPYTMKR